MLARELNDLDEQEASMCRSDAMFAALWVAFGLLITSAPQAATATTDCHTSQQRTADELIVRLNIAGATPKAVSVAERACLVAVAGHVLGRYPASLKDVSSVQNERLRAVVVATVGKYDSNSIASGAVFSQLAADLEKQCQGSTQQTPPESLAAEVAATCGIVSLPGAPRGLGRRTALRESGHSEGGYAEVSGDPGAGVGRTVDIRSHRKPEAWPTSWLCCHAPAINRDVYRRVFGNWEPRFRKPAASMARASARSSSRTPGRSFRSTTGRCSRHKRATKRLSCGSR